MCKPAFFPSDYFFTIVVSILLIMSLAYLFVTVSINIFLLVLIFFSCKCKHQLAARLATCLGACVDVKVSDEQLALLLSKL